MRFILYDLYRDYCNGELDEVINLFVDSGMNASSYYGYYVRDDEVKDEDDMCYDIEEILDDDDIVTQIMAEIDYGNVNVPDELYKLCHVVEWDMIKDDIHASYSLLVKEMHADVMAYPDDIERFERWVCTGSLYKRIRNCLISTKVFNATADDYEILKDMAWTNVIHHIVDFCKDFCKGGVTVEKATEVWVKKNVLEG